MSKILYEPEEEHIHDVESLRGMCIPKLGTTAVCDGCGKVIVYDGDFIGMVQWREEGWFHRRKRLCRERKNRES